MGSDSQSKDPRLEGVLDRGTLVVIMRILTLVKEDSGIARFICYLLSKPKIRGYRKRMLCLWLAKGMFWESEWMTELEIEEGNWEWKGR